MFNVFGSGLGYVMYGQQPQWRIYYLSWLGRLLNISSNATEVIKFAAPRCSRPQQATDYGVGGRIDCQLFPPFTGQYH